MPQQHVQELVADNGLQMRFGVAVLADERQVHEQARPSLARDGSVGTVSVNSTESTFSTARMASGFSSINSVHVVKVSGGHAYPRRSNSSS